MKFGVSQASIVRYGNAGFEESSDALVLEEPLALRVRTKNEDRVLTTTMRTPGHDLELLVGWLHAEGLVRTPDDLAALEQSAAEDNTVVATLRHAPNLEDHARLSATSSACGVCGSRSIEDLLQKACVPISSEARVDAQVLLQLPARLHEAQTVFASTGGLHAAALFDLRGHMLCVREDVGRHNALDKLIGWALLQKLLPLSQHVVLVSGRNGFEIAHKSIAAGVPILASIGAPSGLALRCAQQFNQSVVGFLRQGRFNIYHAPQRIQPTSQHQTHKQTP